MYGCGVGVRVRDVGVGGVHVGMGECVCGEGGDHIKFLLPPSTQHPVVFSIQDS